jgi:hypothetical protein
MSFKIQDSSRDELEARLGVRVRSMASQGVPKTEIRAYIEQQADYLLNFDKSRAVMNTFLQEYF